MKSPFSQLPLKTTRGKTQTLSKPGCLSAVSRENTLQQVLCNGEKQLAQRLKHVIPLHGGWTPSCHFNCDTLNKNLMSFAWPCSCPQVWRRPPPPPTRPQLRVRQQGGRCPLPVRGPPRRRLSCLYKGAVQPDSVDSTVQVQYVGVWLTCSHKDISVSASWWTPTTFSVWWELCLSLYVCIYIFVCVIPSAWLSSGRCSQFTVVNTAYSINKLFWTCE